MKALVVYESLWGNTAAIAGAIARGIGPDATALPTGAATGPVLEGVDLLVVGAPVLGFRLGTDEMLQEIATSERNAPSPPDLSQPSMRSWLDALPAGHAAFAAFETGLWWSPGGATGTISKKLAAAGYRAAGRPTRFVVKGRYGPLRDGEIERAMRWGAELTGAARPDRASPEAQT